MNLLKKITENSKKKFKEIKKKININKDYTFEFTIINKEPKIIFLEKVRSNSPTLHVYVRKSHAISTLPACLRGNLTKFRHFTLVLRDHNIY